MSSYDPVAVRGEVELGKVYANEGTLTKKKSEKSVVASGLMKILSSKHVSANGGEIGMDKSLQLSNMSKQIQDKLKDWDTDGDGNIDEAELADMLESFYRSREVKLVYRNLLIALFVIMSLTVMFLAICTYFVVDTHKDTKVTNDKLLARGSGNVAQCASSDYYVDDQNVLRKRDDGSQRRSLLTNEETQYVSDALAVRSHKQAVTLSSTLPDKYFEELLWFKIVSNTGLQLSFRIQAITRQLTKLAKCGTYLKLVTNAGVIILDDKDIYYSNDLFGLFQESGFRLKDTNSKSKIAGRRLESTSPDVSFSITGFFNAIDNYDWKCESIEKPNLPSTTYALVTKTLSPCVTADGSESKCFFEPYPDNTQEQFGVTTVDGVKYFESKRDMFIQNDGSHTIDYPPYRPGVKLVTSVFAASGKNKSSIWRYQVEDDGTVTHCMAQNDVDEIKMEFPEDFIFYPIDDAGSDLMHFRISYQPDVPKYMKDLLAKTNAPVPDQPWVHVDFFQDRKTKLPKMLISETGETLYVQSLSPKFTPYAGVDDATFQKCLLVSDVWNENKFEEQQSNFTASYFSFPTISKNSSQEDRDIIALWNSWDWNSSYPPADKGPSKFDYVDFEYYFNKNAAGDWLTWATKNYDAIAITKRPAPKPAGFVPSNPQGAKSVDDHPRVGSLLAGFEHYDPVTGGRMAYWGPDKVEEEDNSRALAVPATQDQRDRNLKVDFELIYDQWTPAFTLSAGVGAFSASLAFNFGNDAISIEASVTGCAYLVFCLTGQISVEITAIGEDDSPFPWGGQLEAAIDLTNLLPSEVKGVLSFLKYQIGYIKYAPARGAVSMDWWYYTYFYGDDYPSSHSSFPTLVSNPEVHMHQRMPHRHVITARLNIPFPNLGWVLRGWIAWEMSFPEKRGRYICAARNSAGTYETPRSCTIKDQTWLSWACKYRFKNAYGSVITVDSPYCKSQLPGLYKSWGNTFITPASNPTTAVGQVGIDYYKFWDWPWNWGWRNCWSVTFFSGSF